MQANFGKVLHVKKKKINKKSVQKTSSPICLKTAKLKPDFYPPKIYCSLLDGRYSHVALLVLQVSLHATVSCEIKHEHNPGEEATVDIVAASSWMIPHKEHVEMGPWLR